MRNAKEANYPRTVGKERPSETPIVPVLAHRAQDGSWTLTVVTCPFCKGQHTHMGGRGRDPDGGPKVSHCLVERRAYWLVIEEAS
jgi:hypothetical protein